MSGLSPHAASPGTPAEPAWLTDLRRAGAARF